MSERITDGMVEAFRNSWNQDGLQGRGVQVRIRAGLVAALIQRELEQRTEPELHPINLDPYPATVGEVADEIARYVLELESGPARGLLHDVIDRLNGEYARRNVVVSDECECARDQRMYCHSSKCVGGADLME